MAKNRLKLNWNIYTIEERTNFVNEYLKQPQFQLIPLVPDELETIANYLLWAQDINGFNSEQDGFIEIETKNKTWTNNTTESLDELIESPTFNEAQFRSFSSPQLKVKKENFSREEALRIAPEFLRQEFIGLFHQIDELDYSIALYEFQHNKRKNPPRAELCAQFDQIKPQIEERISHWNQFSYLKRRHLLVELRRQQFTMRDSYVNSIVRETPPEPANIDIILSPTEELYVAPLGTINGKNANLWFRPQFDLNPIAFNEEELSKISDFLWSPRDQNWRTFDFRNPDHVYQFLCALEEVDGHEVALSTKALTDTFDFYVDFAELNDSQRDILRQKISHKKNQDIADSVNALYGKSYTANYISTIFKQKIIPKINEAATLHQKIVENLFFKEEFKQCTTCKKWMLRDSDHFVRKAKTKDGLSSQCKRCDKAQRDSKKVVK